MTRGTLWILAALAAFANAAPQSHGARSLLCSRQANGIPDSSVFLRRAHHASAVLNGRVYIDGGEFSYQTKDGIAYEYSNALLSIDLRRDWTNDSVPLISIPKPPGVPNLSRGGVWAAPRERTLYTGFAGTSPRFGDQAFSPQGLWSFRRDSSGGGTWRCLNDSTDGWFTSQPRPRQGQATSGYGYGFFAGGMPAWNTRVVFPSLTPRVTGDGTGDQRQPDSLVMYAMADKKLSVIANYGLPDPRARAQTGIAYVPNWGNRGILVAVGGTPDRRDNNVILPTFRIVRIYDIDKQRWYDQQSTGAIPEPRQDFCFAGSPSNNRTYELLVYAGWAGQLGPAAVPYDSAYVLTLPGFYWARADYPPAHPRHGLSCNGVGGSQILTIGGVDTTQYGNDSYAAGFATRDPFLQGLAIFDLGALAWSPAYRARRSAQPPAPRFREYYDAKGPAPELGFANPDLQSLFSPSNYRPAPDFPFPSIHSSPSSSRPITAAIIGGTVGGAAGLGLAAWAIAYLFLRQRRSRRLLGHEQEQEQQLEDAACANCGGGGIPAYDDRFEEEEEEEEEEEAEETLAGAGRKMSCTTADGRIYGGRDGGGSGRKRGGAVTADGGYDVYDGDGGHGSSNGSGNKYGYGGRLYRGVIPTRAAMTMGIAAANRRPLPPPAPPPPMMTILPPEPAELASRPLYELEAAGIEPLPYERAGDLAAPESRDSRWPVRGAAGGMAGRSV
ncbi:hypothetical protein VTH06DRAFT_2182 [Thermothelomyces fergusii]